MAKTLEQYRDESRLELGEADIEAAFPMWLIDIDGERRRLSLSEKAGIAVMSVLGVFGVVASVAATVVNAGIRAFRGQNPPHAPHERREMNHDVGQARIVFRPDHIHVHQVIAGKGAGARVADLAEHSVVRIGTDEGGLRRTVVEISGVRWSLRPKHEAALRQLLAARGVQVEPLG